jgi:hypothetical protein
MEPLTPEMITDFKQRTRLHINLFQSIAVTIEEHLLQTNLYQNISNRFSEPPTKVGIPGREVALHDQSKYGDFELEAYARRFCGPNDDPEGWRLALKHHYYVNAHHPQYWSRCKTDMPTNWIMAMVADWMAASIQYTGSLNMTEWLDDTMGREPTHPMSRKTEVKTVIVLHKLGYISNWNNTALWYWSRRDWAKDLETICVEKVDTYRQGTANA